MSGSERTQFKPGQSGNPKGRKKGVPTYRTILRQILAMEADPSDLHRDDDETRNMMAKMEEKLGRRISKKELVTLKLAQQSMRGVIPAMKEMADREEGKVPQTNINENVDVSYEDYLLSLNKEEDDAEGES